MYHTVSDLEAFHFVNQHKILWVGQQGLKMWIISESDCLLPSSGVVAMEDVTRLVSTGDTVKIWDAASMAPLEQFNPHSITHPVAQACWSSNSILGTRFSFSL